MAGEHGIKPGYMDLTADKGKDFNRFANGRWIDETEIPAEYPRWGAFLILREKALQDVRALLEELSTSEGVVDGSNEQKIGDFYASGMNEAQIEADGIKPLACEFARINAVRSRRGLADMVAHLHLLGVNVLFGFGASPDYGNSSQMIAHAVQGGLGLPDRDYYLLEDEKSVALRAKYVEHVARMFELAGEKPAWARKHAKAVMAIETALAKASMSKVDRRDPANVTHKMPSAEFQQLIPSMPIHCYFKKLACPSFDELNVGQPEFFKALSELIATTRLRDIKAYLRWHLLHEAASCLSSSFVSESFDFYDKTLAGTKELAPRWKRVVSMTNGVLGEAVGQKYVAKHFPPAAKARMMELIANLREALKETLTEISWMSDATKRNALAKLDAFVAMIGYPDKWKDYAGLVINRCSYLGNVLRASQFAARLKLAKIGQPVDPNEWHMTPQTVNAYYSPQTNRIVFPAAILQPPFFDPGADDASNYGGIGVVIGHEISHGFDDKGSKFDAQGNVANWWTDDDRANFAGRVDLIKAQFSSFAVAGGKHVNGGLVAGEAVADLGGVKLAYKALKRVLAAKGRLADATGYTDEQRFFIAFGQIWASKVTPEYEGLQVTTDPHPPAQFRVNGTLAHVDEFPKAFGLPDDCPMMLPRDQRCRLW